MDEIIMWTHSWSTNACFERASDLSILFPRTSKGIPFKEGFVRSSFNSLRVIGTLSLSAASTTYLQLHPWLKQTQLYINQEIATPNYSKEQKYTRQYEACVKTSYQRTI